VDGAAASQGGAAVIEVEAAGEHRWRVHLPEEGRSYRVQLDPDTHARLTGGALTPEALLEHSFRFLLEREPASAILSEFELTVIGRYFPEWPEHVAAWARGARAGGRSSRG
jgi:hypothetical protein